MCLEINRLPDTPEVGGALAAMQKVSSSDAMQTLAAPCAKVRFGPFTSIDTKGGKETFAAPAN